MKMSGTLVTQSFGKEDEYRRAIFMIWSYWAYSAISAKVILFTDRPDYFEPYFSGQPIEYVALTPAKIKSMRGDINFLHRMKIALIEESFHMTESNLLYADSDTFFIADPSPLLSKLSPEVAYMHTREYVFEEIRNMPLPAGETFRKFVTLLDKNTSVSADGSLLKISTNQSSWNAGVMMLHPTHRALLQDVYALTDQFYPLTLNHASEQYAFSIVLQNRTVLYSCEEVIYHYWYRVKKQVADVFLERKLPGFMSLAVEQKINLVKKWTQDLQFAFDRHVWILRDQSIQAFHNKEFKKAYIYATKALVKYPFSIAFFKDVLYHTKICLREAFQ